MTQESEDRRTELVRKYDAGELTNLADINRAIRYKEIRKKIQDKRAAVARGEYKIRDAEEPTPKPTPIPQAKKEKPRVVHVPAAGPAGQISDWQKIKLLELIREAGQRKVETLRLYRPMPVQSDFHMSEAHIRILRGGNRCLAPETELYDPVLGIARRVDSIDSDFHVEALDQTTGEIVVARALEPFLKGTADLYEITLSNGRSFRSTLGHQILTMNGWMTVAEAANPVVRVLIPSTPELFQSARDGDDLRSSRTPGGSRGRCSTDRHPCDEQLRPWSETVRGSLPQPGDALARTPHDWPADDLDSKPIHTQTCRSSSHPSTPCGQAHPWGHVAASCIRFSRGPCSRPCHCDQAISPSLRRSLQLHTSGSSPRSANPRSAHPSEKSLLISGSSEQSLRRLRTSLQSPDNTSSPQRKASRPRLGSHEGERQRANSTPGLTWITSISFLRNGPFYDLEVPIYHNYLLASIPHHNSGKSTATICELCWALTGQHPVAGRYPETDGRAIVVAKDIDKIGEVIWRTMGRSGAFKQVVDPVTGEVRLQRPGDRDAGLKMRPAPPLIPPRLIKDISWESKKAGQPRKLILTNGWECNFYSSNADPFSIQGTNIDMCLFDEEITNEGWFTEAVARLLDRGGRLVWGATPQTGTQKLYDLHLRAIEQMEAGESDPLISEHVLTIWDNPYISEEDKQLFLLSLDDEDQIKIRIEGEHAIAGRTIFAPYFFPRGVHAQEPFAIPDDWTRFIAIDPGAQVAAAVFMAIPPKTKPKGDESKLPDSLFGDFAYVYDEIHIKRCDATRLAAAVKGHIGSQMIHTILLDHHGGSLTEIGSGMTPEQQYKQAFKKAKVPLPQVGRYFTYGSDDLSGGILKIKECLRVREDGTPKIKIVTGAAPHLVAAMARYQWKVVNGVITDKPLAKGCDSVDCLRYLMQHPGLKHQKTEGKERKKRTAFDHFKEFKEREQKRKKGDRVGGITL